MFIYYIIFFGLAYKAYKEHNNPTKFIFKEYLILFLFFVLYIGLSNEIGCDWDGLLRLFNYGSLDNYSLSQYFEKKEEGFLLLNLIVNKLSGNIHVLNTILAIIFIIPLLRFCSFLERPYLALLVSYPYLINVIGLSNLRQSITISFFMIGITFLNKYKINKFYIFNAASLLFHKTSIFLFTMPFLISYKDPKYNLYKKKYLFILLPCLILFVIIQFDYFRNQINGYFYIRPMSSSLNFLFLWIMNAIPSLVILFNQNEIIEKEGNNIWKILSIFSLISIFGIFINTVVTLRFFLYLIPIKIYCLTKLPDFNLFNLSKKQSYIISIFISFLILTIWLNFASHAYCYIPYKNILIK